MAHSILDTARELVGSPAAKSAFADDPDAFLAERGLGDLSPADLEDAVAHVADAMPPEVARRLGPVETGGQPAPSGAGSGTWANLASIPEATLVVAATEVAVVPLADPGGLDELSTEAPVAPPVPGPGTDDGEAEESATAADDDPIEDQTEFGRGALDEADEPPTDSSANAHEGDEPDPGSFEAELDDGGRPAPELDLDPDGSVDTAVGEPTPDPGQDEEPPDDDVADVVL